MPNKKIFIADYNPCESNPALYEYTHIRGYHACRPTDVSLYYKEGILVPNNDSRRRVAIEVFRKSLLEIIEAEDESFAVETPQVYFTAFKVELLKDSGHYLCYGSEYLASIASHFDRNIFGNCHNILLKTGVPTIFICDIPIEIIPEYLIADLMASYNPKDTNLSFWIEQNLPPEFIVAHEHPPKIFDPFLHMYRKKYKNRLPIL
ncbi:MAG: hypothetical protein DESF_01394 [Desulfovibrio sp.]